jgi:hypothetical protein
MRKLLLLLLLIPWPASAHQGPPFPVLVDKKTGPYTASVWTDPDVGTGTFFVILEGHPIVPGTRVRIAVQPVTGRLPEAVYEAEPQVEGRYLAKVPFDKQEMWRTRVLVDSAQGGGELVTQVEATPDGILGPLGSLVYAFPFLAVGFLWIKAVLRRRAGGSPAVVGEKGEAQA